VRNATAGAGCIRSITRDPSALKRGTEGAIASMACIEKGSRNRLAYSENGYLKKYTRNSCIKACLALEQNARNTRRNPAGRSARSPNVPRNRRAIFGCVNSGKRFAINALIELCPGPAGSAGWAAAFALVKQFASTRSPPEVIGGGRLMQRAR
jgi:hypothetical protein